MSIAHQFYGFALTEHSPYRDEINAALLTIMENGTYNQLVDRWINSGGLF